MTLSISWPTNTKEVVDKIRTAIGRDITFMKKYTGERCTACDLDPLTGESEEPFCPTCSGYGYITTLSGTNVLAHVNWTDIDPKEFHPGGRIYTGDCRVSVEYTDENLALVTASDYIIVDSRELYLKDYDLRGVPDINRIVVDLIQDPREKR